MDKKRQGLVTVFLALLVIAFTCLALFDLLNKKDLYTVEISSCYELMEVEHSINGLIPMGKDYLYLGYDASSTAYIFKGSKSWYPKNFNADGKPLTGSAVTVTALAKRLDYKVAREIGSSLSQAEGLNLAHSPDYSLEIDYKFRAIVRLILVPIFILVIIAGKIIFDDNRGFSSTIKKVYLLILCVVLFAALKFMF
ncbi:MAG: hypothetical protein IKR68_02420 [Lachnospiraceae bacterium]|nr:hypothetical protein [Lachnospiraceae bacterium]